MSNQPMWRLLHESALKLTQSGQVPFTRADLIAGVRRIKPNVRDNSVNPIIQGITDNLKGGARGADGKKILHSVERGKFVLSAAHELETSATNSDCPNAAQKSPIGDAKLQLPDSENELRDILLALLQARLGDTGWVLEPEGRVLYRLPSGVEFGHASDILVSDPASSRRVSIELKYRSAVTDQFKCPAYDAIHMKRQHGEAILTVMLFAKSDSGISVERARSICYPFDYFYGGPAAEFLEDKGLDEIVRDIKQFFVRRS